MKDKFCSACGTQLTGKMLGIDGMVPYCPHCEEYRFPLYNVAVSMIVVNKETGKILLIQQYGKPSNILVAGYVNRGESAETAVIREVKEETGMTVSEMRFNRTQFFEPSNTLMCNFTAMVESDRELSPNEEIDACHWYTPEEARQNIRQGSLAAYFLNSYLDEVG